MTHSKTANVNLKQSDISHFIPGLVYYCGNKSNDAVLIPICVFIANKLLEQTALRICITYRLKIGHCKTIMIYDSFENSPPYIYVS